MYESDNIGNVKYSFSYALIKVYNIVMLCRNKLTITAKKILVT